MAAIIEVVITSASLSWRCLFSKYRHKDNRWLQFGCPWDGSAPVVWRGNHNCSRLTM